MRHQVVDIAEKAVLPILKAEGFTLAGIEYKKEGRDWFLRVFIDREDGAIQVDDCCRVSEQLSKALDVCDPVADPYFLEVASPGAERPLKKETDYIKAVGKNVYVTTYEPIKGQKVFQGVLVQFENDTLTIQEKDKAIHVPLTKVAKARLAIVF